MRLKHDDAELVVHTKGEGPAVILLHPFPSSHLFWTEVVPRLESRYRIIRPDLRGLGESGVGTGDATMEKHAEDIRRICDELEVTKAVFVGCSIGGYVIFECWRRFKERFNGMILCNTKASADTADARAARLKAADEVLLKGPEQFVDSMIPKLLGETTRRNRPDVVAQARAVMMKSSAQGIAAVQRGMASRPDSTDTLATVDVPTLVIGGEEDVSIPREEIEKLAQGIRGSQLKTIAKAGHYAPFEQSDEFSKILRQFLEAIPRG